MTKLRWIRVVGPLLLAVAGLCLSAVAQQPNWRLSWINYTDFSERIKAAVRQEIPGMPFYTGPASDTHLIPTFLTFGYVARGAPASPITTNPMPFVGLRIEWQVRPHNDNGFPFIIPPASLESEFVRRNEIQGCAAYPLESGISPFGPASCVSSTGSGKREETGANGYARYNGSARIVVVRPCAIISVTGGLDTTTPRGTGLDAGGNPFRDTISESRALASKYSKDVMVNLIRAVDTACAGMTAPPPPATPLPLPPVDPIPGPTPVPPAPPYLPLPGDPSMRKLLLYYNSQHHDSVTVASDEAMRGAAAGGYQPLGDAGGYVFISQAAGTIPLYLWHNGTTGDYLSSTTNDTNGMARLGYRLIRAEGFIYPTAQPNSAALKTFWGAARQDYFTTATSAGETSALQNGYVLSRVEGYVPTASTMISGACGLGTRWDESEDGWSGIWTRRGTGSVFDAVWTSPTGQRASAVMTIGIAGNQVTIRRDQTGLGTCTYRGQIAPDGVNVSGGYTCSWWPNAGTTAWRARINCN